MEKLEAARQDFKRLLWVIGFFSLFTNLLMLAIPLYMLQIYDRILPSQSLATLTFLTIIAFGALLVLGSMESVRTILANRTAARLDAQLGDTVLEEVIRRGAQTGGNSQPVRDLAAVRTLISSRQAFAFLDLPFAAIFIALLFLIHPHLFWITLGGAVLLTGIAILNQYWTSKASNEHGEASLAGSLQSEYLARNADSLIAMGMVSNVVNHWGRTHADAMVKGDEVARINAFFTGLSRFLRLALQIVILGYGAVLVLDGSITPGMIFASSIVSGRALQPIDQVIGSWRALSSGLQSWKRLSGFLGKAGTTRDHTPLPRPEGLLTVKDVVQPNAGDPKGKPVLAGVSFALQPGQSVAVIGPSGSGKSTLARIIVGALKPFKGTVTIDGHDLANWKPETIGSHIGYLAQDVELLPGSVAMNIARFSLDPDPGKVVEAAKLAHAEDLIKTLPKGYDTVIGPGGVQVSGGEKQRIGLARAFYGDPRILVLDEPNANLDRIGEIALNKALAEAKKRGISVFVITQRESVFAQVDLIMRIAGGQILDYGPRDEIIAKYRQPQGSKQPNPDAKADGQPSAPEKAGPQISSKFVPTLRSTPVSAELTNPMMPKSPPKKPSED